MHTEAYAPRGPHLPPWLAAECAFPGGGGDLRRGVVCTDLETRILIEPREPCTAGGAPGSPAPRPLICGYQGVGLWGQGQLFSEHTGDLLSGHGLAVRGGSFLFLPRKCQEALVLWVMPVTQSSE